MSKLLISTQILENYGAHDWGGEGECPQYWKAKGGCDYVVLGVDECDMVDVIVDRARPQIEVDNEIFREYIVAWAVVADDYLTPFEQSQLEWDGEIKFPVQEITL